MAYSNGYEVGDIRTAICLGTKFSRRLRGAGRPLSTETANTKHDKGDAIRFENLVWRLLGKPNNQRDGSDHGDQNGVPMTDSKDLPKFN